MTLISAMAAKIWSLPKARYRVRETTGVRVAMRDGVELVGDLYTPDIEGAPTIMIRSPYGRGSIFALSARLFCERGYQVIVQSCRGTSESQGDISPFFQEKSDGLDTVAWIEAQPWFAGRLGTFGPSYLGNVQWAIASELGDRLSAMAVSISLSNFREETRQGGGFTLEGSLGWAHQIATAEQFQGFKGLFKQVIGHGKVPASLFDHLPLAELDQLATGESLPHWQKWIENDADDDFWQPIDHHANMNAVTCPVTMIAGWSDLFLPFQLRDFAKLRARLSDARITIGPWTHIGAVGKKWPIIDALEWFDHHLKGEKLPAQPRVRYWLGGTKTWRHADEWPPVDGPQATTLYIADQGRLCVAPEGEGSADSFVYDPADPTPSIGGVKISGGGGYGRMGELMKRKDVLSYLSEPLEESCDLIGSVEVEVCVQASAPDHDVFVCLCEMGKDGIPRHLSDGYLRLGSDNPPADKDDCRIVQLDCWPIARRVGQGSRLCLMIAAGAHPRYARNLGMGEPLQSATKMQAVEIKVQHGATKITLPGALSEQSS